MDPKVDARSRFSVIAGILVGVALVSALVACWGLLSPASRAAKCWVQFEDARTSVFIAVILGSAGCVIWIVARTLTRGQPAERGILIATFFTVPVLIVPLLPFVILGAYPLDSGLRSDCDRSEPSGIIVSSAALVPLLGILVAAVASQAAIKLKSRGGADPEQDQ